MKCSRMGPGLLSVAASVSTPGFEFLMIQRSQSSTLRLKNKLPAVIGGFVDNSLCRPNNHKDCSNLRDKRKRDISGQRRIHQSRLRYYVIAWSIAVGREGK